MSYIERTYEGVRAECGAMQSEQDKTTFRHAIASFGFLIPNNSRLDLADFADRIEAHSTAPQAVECARVVRAAI